MGFEDYVGNIYSGKEFNKLCEKEDWELVKFLSSNDLSKPQKDHYNFHYKIGENFIPEKEVNLSRDNECSRGGLYFTFFSGGQIWTKQHCFKVSIPENARVLIEFGKKFKADRLILIEEMSEEFYEKNIKTDSRWLDNISKQSPSVCLAAVRRAGSALKLVKEQTPEICLVAVQKEGLALQYVENQTFEICLVAVRKNGNALRYVKEQTPEICLAAVQEDGWALMYVKKQTPEICLAAVQRNGHTLEFVREQTPEICLAAVQQNGWALPCVKKQTPEICLAAVRQNGNALCYVKEKTEKIRLAALIKINQSKDALGRV